MDFNDLNSKLKRLYSTLGEQYDEDIASSIVDTYTSDESGRFEHRTTFGANEPEKNINIVMNTIHSIGSLKDIIKQKLVEQKKDPRLYEELINNNIALALVTDLDNKEKHGEPLKQPMRSGKDPKVTNIDQVLHGQGITKVSFTTNFSTGKTVLNSAEGNVKVEVVADVVDSDGNLIMPLSALVDESFSVIQTFVDDHKLV